MLEPNSIIDSRYRILHRIGSGGFGQVYLAEELAADVLYDDGSPTTPGVLRRVALKLLNECRFDTQRFATEVRALCRLSHPSIVRVLAYNRTESAYLAMEYVDGVGLDDAARYQLEGDFTAIVRILIDVADALAHAHGRGVVHRDLKPNNILIDSEGRARIIDFGLSWLQRNDEHSTTAGTPGFIAPELQSSFTAEWDHRSDIYSFGVTMFTVFAGHIPFQGISFHTIAQRQRAGDFEFPESFPHCLRTITAACLDAEPSCRPRSAAAIADELRRILFTFSESDDPTITEVPDLAAETDLLSVTVDAVETFTHPSRGPGARLFLTAPRQLDGQAVPGGVAVRAFVYRERPSGPASRIHDIAVQLWRGACVHLLGVRVRRADDGSLFAQLTDDSFLVVEPHLPITVTEIAEADGVRASACATRALVDARQPQTSSSHMVAGSLAHAVLQHLLENPDAATSDEAAGIFFDQTLPEYRLAACAAAMSEHDLQNVRPTVEVAWELLQSWLRSSHGLQSETAAESRRMSSLWGMEGRIDAVSVSAAAVHVVELKTGKHRPSNDTQLAAYLMLWEAFARAHGRALDGQLWFTRGGRIHEFDPASIRRSEVVYVRNCLVIMRQSLADSVARFHVGPNPALPAPADFPERCNDQSCTYRRQDCLAQSSRLGGVNGLHPELLPPPSHGPTIELMARAYYHHFLQLIERENRATSRRMGDSVRRSALTDRIQRHQAVEGMRFARIEPLRRTATLVGEHRGIFSPEQRVLLHRGDLEADLFFSGEVIEVRDGQIDVLLSSLPGSEIDDQSDWFIELETSRVGYRDMHRALFAFVTRPQDPLLRTIVSPVAPVAPSVALGQSCASLERLNYDQQRAVLAGLADQPLLAIQGPPGTGKTEVIAALVAQLVASGKHVLVAACTNTAVDTALARVIAHGITAVLRIQSARKSTPELRSQLAFAHLQSEAVFSVDMGRHATSIDELAVQLGSSRVVAATTNACASSNVFDILRRQWDVPAQEPLFDVVIVDEAAQLVEPLALAALALGRRAVLVGDDQQLPPVVTASDARSENVTHEMSAGWYRQGARLSGLDRSLFERIKPGIPSVLLREQYRMNQHVQEFPNRAFYGGMLRAADAVAARTFPVDLTRLRALADQDLRRRLDPTRSCVWVEARGAADGNVHWGEAEEVVNTLLAAIEARPDDARLPDATLFGVVSPYRAQCQAIRSIMRRRLPAAWFHAIEVDTADRFQGRQKEAILLSLVRGDWSDFVMDSRRLNVALTRARTKVVIFGHRELGRRMVEVYCPVESGPEPGATHTAHTPLVQQRLL